ncbi:MAG: FlgO family outer membrane protein [Burkholderiaceae bacterium]|jgi:TolB-like protein
MKKLALVFSSLYLAGCAAVAQQPAPAPAPAAAAPAPVPVRAAPVLSEAEVFQQAVAELAGQLNQNMGRRAGQVFILTSFSDLNRLQESSHLGQLLSENLIHELQVRGWDLVELRLANAVSVNSAGEFGLSREHRRLKEQFQASGIITGTYSLAGRYVMVNARVMNYETGAVVSTAQVRLPMSAFVEGLAHGGKPQAAHAVRITGGAEAR